MADDSALLQDTGQGAAAGSVGGPWGAVAGAGLGLAGGLAGMGKSNSAAGSAADLRAQALAAMNAVPLPTDLANKIYYNQYQNAGALTPTQEQTLNAAPSIAGQTIGNAGLQSAQMQALNAMKNVSQTGMSSTDRARLNQIQQQAATQAEGQKQAVMQNFAQRGQGGSGNELLAQLQASQNASNQANQAGLGVAANAQQNALSALGQYGQQAGQMEGQQFGQQFQAGSAADQLNRFNTQNQLSQQARNVAGQNAAQQYNLQNSQNLANANTGQTNQEMLRGVNAKQQLFNDAITKAGGQASADFTGAQGAIQAGNTAATGMQNIGEGAGQMANAGIGLYNQNDENPDSGNPDSGNIASGDMNALNAYGDAMNGNGAGASGNHYGSASANGGWANGGMIQHFDDGGTVGYNGQVPPPIPQQQPQQNPPSDPNADWLAIAKHLMTDPTQRTPHMYNGGAFPGMSQGGVTPANDYGGGANTFNSGGPVQPYGGQIDPATMNQGGMSCYAQGGMSPMMASLMERGGHVPGHPQVPGDSLQNDKVHALLSPGEIVIPRSITTHPDAPNLAKDFVSLELRKKHQR